MAVLHLQPSGHRIPYSLLDHTLHRSNGFGTGLSWAEQIIAEGNSVGFSDPFIGSDSQGAPTDTWRGLYRIICLFDLTSIPISQTITSAQIKALGRDKYQQTGNPLPNINIYQSNPASDSEVVGPDYSTFGSTPYCNTPIEYNDWLEGDWNIFELNAAGLFAVRAAREGIFKTGFRNASYDVAGIAPDWPASVYVRIERSFTLMGLAYTQAQIIG